MLISSLDRCDIIDIIISILVTIMYYNVTKQERMTTMKIKWKITLALNILLLVIIAFSTVLIKIKITDLVKTETKDELKNYSIMGLTLLDAKYPGDWSLDGTTLYKGETAINDNFEVVDDITADTGILATVFAGDTRVSTTVKDDNGKRKTGTQASEAVINKVLRKGEIYLGTADVSGKSADTYYTPIKDKNGVIIGMWFVGVYTDVINQKISHSMITTASFLAAFLVIGFIISFFLGGYIAKAFGVIRTNLEHLEKGDFTVMFHVKHRTRKDEVGEIINSFHNMQEKINNIILSIQSSTKELSNSSIILSDTTNDVYQDVANITTTTMELSAEMEEMSASTQEMSATSLAIEEEIGRVTEKASNGQQLTAEIKERAQNLKTVALESQSTATTIYQNANLRLRQSIEKAAAINEIKALSKTILAITAQTNLLALNASIESARAGEAGKGFAVVASEIATLAQNSKNAVSQIELISNAISTTVEDIVSDSRQMLEFMDTKVIKDYGVLVKTGEQYNDDADIVEQMVREIKTSAIQLSESISYIRRAIDEVTKASQEGSKGSSDIAENSASIYHKTNDVLEQVNKNKTIAANLSEIMKFFQF